MGEVVQLQLRSVMLASSREYRAPHEPVDVRVIDVSDAPTPREQAAIADDIYPDLSESPSVLGPALALLREADEKLNSAVSLAEDDDLISADDNVQQVHALLPELFCCRSLGDSFATVISALFHGLSNLRGAPVTMSQLVVVSESIRRLRREPFMHYDHALVLARKLEMTGMTVDPAALPEISEALLG